MRTYTLKTNNFIITETPGERLLLIHDKWKEFDECGALRYFEKRSEDLHEKLKKFEDFSVPLSLTEAQELRECVDDLIDMKSLIQRRQ